MAVKEPLEDILVHGDKIGMQLERIADSLEKIVGYIERDVAEELKSHLNERERLASKDNQ